MFSDMQREYNMLKDEHDEMKRAADRYREELHQRKEELKGASELLAGCQKSLLTAENLQTCGDSWLTSAGGPEALPIIRADG